MAWGAGSAAAEESNFAPPTGDISFTFIERISTTNAHQAAATVGQERWHLVRDLAADQYWIQIFDVRGRFITEIDTEAMADGAHMQTSGVFYDASFDADNVYVLLNNYPTTPERGWVLVIDRVTREEVSHTELTGAKWTESITRWNGSWWEVNASGHEIREFNDSFVLQNTHSLPDTSPGTDGGGLFWQGIIEADDVFYINLHEGTNSPDIRAYEWNGSGFDAVATSASPPATACTQGFTKEGPRTVIWAERTGDDNTVRSTLRDGYTLDGVPILEGKVGTALQSFTLTPFNGTAPHTHSIADGALPTGVSVASSTGVYSGTPTVAGAFTFTPKAVDNVAAEAWLEQTTINIWPSSVGDDWIRIAAQSDPIYGMGLMVDLAGFSSAFWSAVDADGGNIRAYEGNGSSSYEIPLHMVTIDKVAETGIIFIRPTLIGTDFTTDIKITPDGSGGLRAASHALGQHGVWQDYTGVYAFDGDLTDWSPNGNDLTVRTGTAAYGGSADGVGTQGLDTSGGNFQATANIGVDGHPYPATLFCSVRRTVESSENQMAIGLNSAISSASTRWGLGENNTTSKYATFNTEDSFTDSTVNSTLDTNAILQHAVAANTFEGDDFYVNGALAATEGVNLSGKESDEIIIGNASSNSYFRGHIAFAYVGRFYANASRAALESAMIKNNSSVLTKGTG